MSNNDSTEKEEVADLQSLGIDPKRKSDLNDQKELKELADNIKQSMFQDYKTAYSKKGKEHEEEAKSTVAT